MGLSAGIQYLGQEKQASAAQDAANAQSAAAQQALDFTKQSRQSAVDALQGMVTPQTMANYQQSLTQQEQLVQQQESLASQLNPNLVQAGANLLQMLQGGNSPMTKNIQDQRNQQRAQLVNQLNASGVGANSSAGMQQLQQFDLGTQDAVTNANYNYTGQMGQLQTALGGLGGQLNSQASGMNTGYNSMLYANNPYVQQQTQVAGAYIGSMPALNQSYGQVINAAGNSSAGAMISGQALSNVGSNLQSQNMAAASTLGSMFAL